MTTRCAEPSDAEAVIALMAGLGRPAVTEGDDQAAVFRAHLEHPDGEIFVAELEGTIAGAVSLWFRPRLNWTRPEAWVPDLYVNPAFRRRDACVEAARERGCHRLVLESGHERAEAHQLYVDYGFTDGGRAYGIRIE